MSQAFLSEASVLSRAVNWEGALLPRAPKVSVPRMPDCRQLLSQLQSSCIQLYHYSSEVLRCVDKLRLLRINQPVPHPDNGSITQA